MAEAFVEWLCNVPGAVAEWFCIVICDLMEYAVDNMKKILQWTVIVLLLPLWIIPFLYWYFVVWKKGDIEE